MQELVMFRKGENAKSRQMVEKSRWNRLNTQQGTFEQGTFEQGTFEQGAFEQGTFEQGTFNFCNVHHRRLHQR